jgi:hypothetical protein
MGDGKNIPLGCAGDKYSSDKPLSAKPTDRAIITCSGFGFIKTTIHFRLFWGPVAAVQRHQVTTGTKIWKASIWLGRTREKTFTVEPNSASCLKEQAA